MSELSLQEINAALAPFKQELADRMHWETLIEDFTKKQQSLQQQIAMLDAQIEEERADVDRIEKPGMYRFWQTLKGKRDEEAQKEYEEWQAALGEREALAGRLAEIEERLQFLRGRKAQLGDIDKPLEELLHLKRKTLRSLIKDPLHQVESQISDLKIDLLGLSGIQVPLPGTIYELKRLQRAIKLNRRRYEKDPPKLQQHYRDNFDSLDRRFHSIATSIDLYHRRAERQLPLTGELLRAFRQELEGLPPTELAVFLLQWWAQITSLQRSVQEREAQTQEYLKSCQEQYQERLLAD